MQSVYSGMQILWHSSSVSGPSPRNFTPSLQLPFARHFPFPVVLSFVSGCGRWTHLALVSGLLSRRMATSAGRQGLGTREPGTSNQGPSWNAVIQSSRHSVIQSASHPVTHPSSCTLFLCVSALKELWFWGCRTDFGTDFSPAFQHFPQPGSSAKPPALH